MATANSPGPQSQSQEQEQVPASQEELAQQQQQQQHAFFGKLLHEVFESAPVAQGLSDLNCKAQRLECVLAWGRGFAANVVALLTRSQ